MINKKLYYISGVKKNSDRAVTVQATDLFSAVSIFNTMVEKIDTEFSMVTLSKGDTLLKLRMTNDKYTIESEEENI